MKQVIALTLLVAMSSTLFSQQTVTSKSFTREDYLRKSRNQKTVGWILIGTSVLMYGSALAAATVDGIAQVNHDLWSAIDQNTPPVKKNNKVITRMAITGTVALFGSIPFFDAASKNKKRANALSFSLKSENVFLVQNASLVPQVIPALSLKISI